MNRRLANRHQWRIEMARSILMACNGDIDKAMKHEKMPYKKKSTVMKLAKESECFKDIELYTSPHCQDKKSGFLRCQG